MRPKSSRGRRTPFVVGVVAATALLWTSAAGPAVAAPQRPPPPTEEQRAGALIRPAVVYLEITATADVRTPGGTVRGYPANVSCTGFVVNPNGYVATAGHCLDTTAEVPEGLWGVVAGSVVAQVQAASPDLSRAQLAALLRGYAIGPITRTVKVYTGSGAGTGMLGRSAAGQVLDVVPFARGDVALLKIEATDLPSVELATDADVRQGVRVLSVGYPGNRQDVIDVTIEPTFKEGQVSSRTTSGGKPVYEGRVERAERWADGAPRRPRDRGQQLRARRRPQRVRLRGPRRDPRRDADQEQRHSRARPAGSGLPRGADRVLRGAVHPRHR